MMTSTVSAAFKKLLPVAALAAAGLVAAGPANDWNKPCFHGECAYELSEAASGGMHMGTLKLFGSSKAISDITAAAGWVILDCDPNALAQEIRLVCKTDDLSESGCAHLFDHGGPDDKIVRLPESCGAGPFARISGVKAAKDQSIPAHAEPHITRRDGIAPQVHTIHVDTNYAAINEEKTGLVHFIFQGGNLPGINQAVNFDPPNQFMDEGLWDWLKQKVSEFKAAVKDLFEKVEEKIADLTTVKFDNKKTLPGFSFDAPMWTLFAYNTKCDANVFKNAKANIAASIDVRAGGSGSITPTVGVIAAGVVSRLQVTEFGAFIRFSAELKLKFLLHAALTGSADSGRKELFKKGIPPLDIPGFLTLGPSFVLEGQVQGSFNVIFDADISLAWKNSDLEFWFPEKASNSASKGVTPGDTPLTITAIPSVSGKATISLSLIPQVKLGLSIFSASANLYCATTGTAQVKLEGQVSGKLGKRADALLLGEADAQAGKAGARQVSPPYGLEARALAVREQEAITASWCFRFVLSVSIAGGVEGKFFSFWSGRKELRPFYSGSWEIFKTGNCAAKRELLLSSLTVEVFKRANEFRCPANAAAEAQSVAKKTVSGSAVKKA